MNAAMNAVMLNLPDRALSARNTHFPLFVYIEHFATVSEVLQHAFH
jgi:hypothetical protein